MRVLMPGISWHNRERISSVDFQPVSYPPGKTGKKTRLASAGDDHHVVVSRNACCKRRLQIVNPRMGSSP